MLASVLLVASPAALAPSIPPVLPTATAPAVRALPRVAPTGSAAPSAPPVAAAVTPPSVPSPATLPPVVNPIASQAVASPALPDRAPDYQAAYLHNPRPAYPPLAVRMGWQGRVVLQVEVLRDGRAGQMSVARSSGHAVLDEAAMQAVRGWQFVPARRDGQLVDQTFLVPLPFVLKESDDD